MLPIISIIELLSLLVIAMADGPPHVDKVVCDSPVYCNGTILGKVQMANLFDDPKRFVDKPCLHNETELLRRFSRINDSDPSSLYEFVKANFDSAGHELVPVVPRDWRVELSIRTKDPKLTEFARVVHGKWKGLVRKVDLSKLCSNCASSVIPLPEPFVVPGGRFRELYYWDSFWILEGLYVSGMCETAGSMITNYLWLLERYGFIPNGSRIYYLNRSHPPLFARMVKRYMENCVAQEKQKEWLKDILPLLDREYNFWQTKRAISLDPTEAPLNIYSAATRLPRPEAYLQDFQVGQCPSFSQSPADQEQLMQDIASAAESGLDFTSRWFAAEEENGDGSAGGGSHGHGNFTADLAKMRTTSLVPVDLNGLLYEVENLLSGFHEYIGSAERASSYKNAATRRLASMKKFLWNESSQCWLDYNHTARAQVSNKTPFYLSNLSPLWTGAHDLETSSVERILHKHHAILQDHSGGIPFDEHVTGQQWDFPNVWAPHQYYLVQVYEQLANVTGGKDEWSEAAFSVAQRFINTTYCGYKRYGKFASAYLYELICLSCMGCRSIF